MKSKWIFLKIQLQLLSDRATNQPFNAIYLTLFLKGPKHPPFFFFYFFDHFWFHAKAFIFRTGEKKKKASCEMDNGH